MEPQSSQLSSRSPVQDRPLRVLIDARKTGDGGIGVYIDNLIHGLCSLPQVDVTVVTRDSRAASRSWFPRITAIFDEARPYSWDEYFGMTKRIDFRRFDLFHVPHFTLPFGVPIPTVMTLHDLIHIYYPQHRYYPLVAAPLLASALRRATKIITVSEATTAELRRFSGDSPRIMRKTTCIPNALDPAYMLTDEQREFSRARTRQFGRYLLSVVSTPKPHKGTEDLLAAFAKARLCVPDLQLVLVGHGTAHTSWIEPLLKRSGARDGTHVVGDVSKEELISLHAGALALVVASKVEGFCLPALEAKATGTRVIARPAAAVKEILSGGDLVVEDFSIESLTKGIIAISQQDASTPSSRAARLELAERFSRDGMAAQVAAIYSEMAGASRRKNA